MPLPNFLIIGAQKAGTTWLADHLAQHPDVFIAEQEIHYFDKDFNYARGISWYESHFNTVTREKMIGEKTPDYLWANGVGVEGHLPDVHKNIFKALPKAKLIVVLRNPVERAISAVNHIIRSGRIPPWHSMDDLLLGRKWHLVEGHGVIDYGRYFRQIMAYRECYDPDRMLVLIFEEDIVKDPAHGLKMTCQFLGVDPSFAFRKMNERSNESRVSRVGLTLAYCLPSIRRIFLRIDRYLPAAKLRPSRYVIDQLYELYAEENERLFNLLKRRPLSWKNGCA